MELLIGVDGGATKTRVVIGDSTGAVLAEGGAGATNYQVVGVAQAGDNLAAALNDALASLPDKRFLSARLVVGLAGLDSADDLPIIRAWVTTALEQYSFPTAWRAVNDSVIAWAGALGGEPGGIVISGSGAIALAVNGLGEAFQTDGLGHWLGDEGSGFEIGRNGLRAALRALEGRGPQTTLTTQLRHLAGHEIENWVAKLTAVDGLAHRALTDFAPAVVDAGRQGDEVSLAILADAGMALAATASGALRRAGLAHLPTLATVGSLFAHAVPLRSAFCGRIGEVLPGCQIVWPRQQPAEGALLLARTPAIVPKNVLSVTNVTLER